MLYLQKRSLSKYLNTFRGKPAISKFEQPHPYSRFISVLCNRLLFGPPMFCTHLQPIRSRSHGFGTNKVYYNLHLRFAFATLFFYISLQTLLTRQFMIQKYVVSQNLLLLIKLTIFGLFHSRCVLFIFPSLTRSLSLSLCFIFRRWDFDVQTDQSLPSSFYYVLITLKVFNLS